MVPLEEAAARRVVLVQAFDGAESPLWTREDGAWATRLAVQALGTEAPAERLLAERARHALQRLEPRDRGVRRWLARPLWRWQWLPLALLLGAVSGLGADLLDRHQIVNILAPAAWGVMAWNLAVYGLLLWSAWPRRAQPAAAGRGLRRLLLAWWQRAGGSGPLRVASRRWAELAAPLALTRIAALLHVAAAAFALGLIGSLYLRGLVLDFRAGWQSTFVDAPLVHQVLLHALAPASWLTGIGVPDAAAIAAMRLTEPGQAASASAAPWIHLYAATLTLAVVLPRLLLALGALVRAAWRARRFALPLTDPALLREVQQLRRQPAVVQVCPYAQAPGAQAALGLRKLLVSELGDDVQLQVAAVTAVGDEDDAARQVGAATGLTLRVLLIDLSATPEDDHHGRFVDALRAAAPSLPLQLMLDESAYRQRFASLPERLAERRAVWRRWAAGREISSRAVALDQLDAMAPRAGSNGVPGGVPGEVPGDVLPNASGGSPDAVAGTRPSPAAPAR
ncbi:MAG: DUF2868 domain-containing protein [Ideonella sp.]|nr:DUF2868 domain-containing protein [Ideonella sp.]MCC7458883.1 DUF2868 domain-containing protein [Nitrospira sp.]